LEFLSHDYKQKPALERVVIAERLAAAMDRNYHHYDDVVAVLYEINRSMSVEILARYLVLSQGRNEKNWKTPSIIFT